MNARKFAVVISLLAATVTTLSLGGCGSSTESKTAAATTQPSVALKTVENFISTEELAKNQQNILIIDVRSAANYTAGHIPGAVRNTVSLYSATPSETGAAGTLGLTQAEFVNLANTPG